MKTDAELLDKLGRIIKQRGSIEFRWIDDPGEYGLIKPYFVDEGHRRTGDNIRGFLEWIEEED